MVSELNTAAMVPGGWVNTGQGMSVEHHSYIDADTSSDGRKTIFATSSGQISTFGPNGWSHSALPSEPFSIRNSVAFDRQDNASMLHLSHAGDLTLSTQRNGLCWQSNAVGSGNTSTFGFGGYALAYDSYNQAHVIASNGFAGVYGTKGVLTQQQWNFQHSPRSYPVGGGLPGLEFGNSLRIQEGSIFLTLSCQGPSYFPSLPDQRSSLNSKLSEILANNSYNAIH